MKRASRGGVSLIGKTLVFKIIVTGSTPVPLGPVCSHASLKFNFFAVSMAKLVDAPDLKSVFCGFKSHLRHLQFFVY